MNTRTLAVVLALAAALVGCGGGGSSDAPSPTATPSAPAVIDKLISAVGPVSDEFTTALSNVVQRKLVLQSYTNATGAPLGIAITVTGTRTVTADAAFTGNAFARSNLSVLLNGHLLLGPAGTSCGDAVRCPVDPTCVTSCELQPPNLTNSGPITAGMSITWQDSISWSYTLAPGDKVEATSIADLLPVSASGAVLLKTTGLTMEISRT